MMTFVWQVGKVRQTNIGCSGFGISPFESLSGANAPSCITCITTGGDNMDFSTNPDRLQSE